MANILSGKDVALALKEKTARLVDNLHKTGKIPTLAVIRVGERPDDLYYQQGLGKTCQATNVSFRIIALPEQTGQKNLEAAILKAAGDDLIDGILLFCPLPKNLDEKKARSLIPMKKDVDSLTQTSAAAVFTGEQNGFAPCTADAVMEILAHYEIELTGKNVTVVGRSLVVGKPLAMLLLGKNATVTICHSKTKDLPNVCQKADILIAAIGRARMIDDTFVSPGQIVIDVGINADPQNEGKIYGDVDFAKVEPICAAITPVPGGVGTTTSAVLCYHTVLAATRKSEAGAS